MYLLNAVFHILHIAIILSSLFMWLFEPLVGYHLILQATILSSWLILGPIINKPGMCLLTEIQKKMGLGGRNGFPESYIFYLCKKFGYKGDDTKKVDVITFSIFTVCTVASLARYFT